MQVPVKKVHPEARIPARAYGKGDAGFDLASVEELVLGEGERALVRTGIAVAIPPGYAGLVLPRSGLAAKYGITLTNAPGLIDSNYRGEIKVIVQNTGHGEFTIGKGDRIAQLVVTPVAAVEFQVVAELRESERGEGGFGSSGV